MTEPISEGVASRYMHYLGYLYSLADEDPWVSASGIGKALGYAPPTVRLDLRLLRRQFSLPEARRWRARELISRMERFIGFQNALPAILVGEDRLTLQRLRMSNLAAWNLPIAAIFSMDARPGRRFGDIPIYPLCSLPEFLQRTRVNLVMLGEGCGDVQQQCDLVVSHGVHAIWNFCQRIPTVPREVCLLSDHPGQALGEIPRFLKQQRAAQNA